MNTANTRVVVIGGGIVGASIALGLAKRGAQVRLLEAKTLGSGTTSTSLGWTNANGKEPDSYYAINKAGMEAHRKFAEGAPGAANWYGNTGHLEIATEPSHERHLRRRANALVSRDYRVEELTVEEARGLEPALYVPNDARALLYFPDEGHIYPLLYLAEVVSQLRAAGGEVTEHAQVCGFDSTPTGPVVCTDDGERYYTDQVVVAAGRWTDHITELTGGDVPLVDFTHAGDITVGYLARTNALPVKLSRLVTTPSVNTRPDGGGRLLLQALDLDESAEPTHVPEVDSTLASEFLTRLQAVLYGSTGAQIEEILVGRRAMPADGKTIASPVPGVEWMYAVATHSGVTLAPYLGSAVADEVLGETAPLLEDFRLSRFTKKVTPDLPGKLREPGQQ